MAGKVGCEIKMFFPFAVVGYLRLLEIAVLGLLVSASDDVTVDNCYEVASLRRECFLYPLNWHTAYNWAQEFCLQHDASLVTVDSAHMQVAVEKFAKFAKFGESILVGAKRSSSVDWTWHNDFDFHGSVTNMSEIVDYRTHGAVKQSASDQKTLFVARHPTDSLYYICQYKVGSSECTRPAAVTHGAACYIPLSDQPLPWHSARNKCILGGGDLAAFADISSNVITLLTSAVKDAPFWVGLRTSWWSWPNGEEMLYSHWSPGQPTDASSYCVVMSSSNPWMWKTSNCDDRIPVFVCQQQVETSSCRGACPALIVLAVIITTAVTIVKRNIFRRWLVDLKIRIRRTLRMR